MGFSKKIGFLKLAIVGAAIQGVVISGDALSASSTETGVGSLRNLKIHGQLPSPLRSPAGVLERNSQLFASEVSSSELQTWKVRCLDLGDSPEGFDSRVSATGEFEVNLAHEKGASVGCFLVRPNAAPVATFVFERPAGFFDWLGKKSTSEFRPNAETDAVDFGKLVYRPQSHELVVSIDQILERVYPIQDLPPREVAAVQTK